jgi:hypothetical protein
MKTMLSKKELEAVSSLLINVGVANTLTAISEICAERATVSVDHHAYWQAASEKALEAAEAIREYA